MRLWGEGLGGQRAEPSLCERLADVVQSARRASQDRALGRGLTVRVRMVGAQGLPDGMIRHYGSVCNAGRAGRRQSCGLGRARRVRFSTARSELRARANPAARGCVCVCVCVCARARARACVFVRVGAVCV